MYRWKFTQSSFGHYVSAVIMLARKFPKMDQQQIEDVAGNMVSQLQLFENDSFKEIGVIDGKEGVVLCCTTANGNEIDVRLS